MLRLVLILVEVCCGGVVQDGISNRKPVELIIGIALAIIAGSGFYIKPHKSIGGKENNTEGAK